MEYKTHHTNWTPELAEQVKDLWYLDTLSQENIIQRNMKYNEIHKIWDNETVYIVGGGPILKDFDFNRLKGHKVIGINRAYEVVPFADALYWTDKSFYMTHKGGVDSFKGMKVTTNDWHSMPDSIIKLLATYQEPIDFTLNSLSRGNNSGYGAINLAVRLGAKKIILLGFDMQHSNGSSHWHDGYDTTFTLLDPYVKMMHEYKRLPQALSDLGIEVINASIDSRLDVFPRINLDEIDI